MVRAAAHSGKIVIAHHAQRALRHIARDAIDNIAGLGAIADQIAEIDEFFRAKAQGFGATGVESLTVGVNICEQGDEHFDPGQCSLGLF